MTESASPESATPPARTRRRPIAVGAGVAVALVVVVTVVVAASSSVAPPPVQLTSDAAADEAPTFAMASLTDDDIVIDLADHAGAPVVLNFWASWCVPCRREMPAFETVHRDYTGRVAFIGVNHQDNRRDALALVAETGVTYPSAYDPQGVIAYDYDLFGMPTTVFIDRHGRIRAHHTGELTDAELRDTLDQLLADDR